MAVRKPIVIVAGERQQLQAGDTIDGLPVLLESGSFTNQATKNFDISAYNTLYKRIELRITSMRPATTSTVLYVRLASTTATNFITSGYKWVFYYGIGGGGGTAAVDDATIATFIQTTGTCSNVSTASVDLTLELINPGSSALWPRVRFKTDRINDAPVPVVAIGNGYITSALAIKGFQVLFNSGNIAAADYSLWGHVYN